MAVTQQTKSGRPRMLYGANAIFAVVLAFGVLVMAVWLAGNFKTQLDWTSGGLNSLSPSTTKLMRGLEEHVTITGIYAVLSEYQQFAQKRQDRVRDMLSLYESMGGGKVTARVIDPMKDQAATPAIIERLKNKPAYLEEAAPHKAALDNFKTLNEAIAGVGVDLSRRMLEMPQADTIDKIDIVARNFQAIAEDARVQGNAIEQLAKAEIPAYGRAIDSIRAYLTRPQGIFESGALWMRNARSTHANLPSESAEILDSGAEQLTQVVADIKKLLDDSKDLKPVELEKLYDNLRDSVNRSVILVETDQKARIVSFNDVWPFRDADAPRPPDGDERRFDGERAISSAVLQLTQKERTAIVFTHWGGPSPLLPDFSRMNMMNMRQMPRAPYQQVKSVLEDANFIVEAWDVKTTKTPPQIEDASRTVYVVFPPQQPQRNPMQPQGQPGISPADVKLITDAVDDSGMALFMANWIGRQGPMAMMMGGRYAFDQYLKTEWGVDVRANMLTVFFAPAQQATEPGLWQPRTALLQTLTSPPQLQFAKHEISSQLASLVTAVNQFCPVMINAQSPEGVTVRPVLQVAPSDDVWAIPNMMKIDSDMRSKRGTNPGDDDLLAQPDGFAVMVACEKTAAEGEAPSRVLVIGSDNSFADQMAFYRRAMLTSRGIEMADMFPGNLELFTASLHWLSGNAERIAIGPPRDEVRRLDRLTEGTPKILAQGFLFIVWPALALFAGGGVWLFRRR